MGQDSVAGEHGLADAQYDVGTSEDQPRFKRRRVKVRRKQEKFSPALRIAILIGAPAVLWIGIYLIGSALL